MLWKRGKLNKGFVIYLADDDKERLITTSVRIGFPFVVAPRGTPNYSQPGDHALTAAENWFRFGSVLALSILTTLQAMAGPSSDVLLPRTTKGYVSVAQPTEFEARWNKTQLGQMFNDPVMQPFVEDLKKQLQEKYRAVEEKLGITWDDLDGVPAGEMSLSLIERQGADAALAITIDVTNHEQQAEGLLAAVERRFAARGGRRENTSSGGTELRVFTVPSDAGSPPQQTIYFVKDNLLCGIDDRKEADAILQRFAGEPTDNLRSVPAYRMTMERCGREAGQLAPEARWYVDPFGLTFAARTLEKTARRPNEQDVAKILYETGFDAVQGAGGYLNQLVEGHIEFLNRAAVYAPPAPGKENDPLRWNLSMRMLQLPNAAGFEPQSWVPRMSAGYSTLQLEIDKAFDNVGPLFDALQEHEDAWVNTLEGWKTDPYGPKVDVQNEFIVNLGQRITIVTDYDMPIGVKSERSIFAIEATNEQALAATLEKWMSKEPDVVRRAEGQFVIWERVPEQVDVSHPGIDVLPPGFERVTTETDKQADEDDEQVERVLPNSAVCVALGHLMMASDIEYLREVLEGFAQRERLASSLDYQQVVEEMENLAPGERCAWSFGRTDEEIRPTFELLRQGKMPEAETMLAKFLNNVLTTEVEREEGTIRKQRIDGSRLPDFETVRRYLGPAGRALRSENDGWIYTGALLNKEAP
jgi:hypothetical protein